MNDPGQARVYAIPDQDFWSQVSLTPCQQALDQTLTFRLGTQLMDEVESSAQFEVARFSECKCVMHQPDTVR